MTKAIKLEISKIRIDGGTQSRVEINQRIVEEYCEALDNGDTFPPLDVFHDAADYWLADGFHRLEAFKARKIKRCDVIVRQGGQRAAVLWSVAANGKHGLRRSNEDKRKSVMTLLGDEEWSKWSNREIARRVDVDESTVRKYREEFSAANPDLTAGIPQSRIGGDGRVINTANIGKQPEKPAAEQPASESAKPAESPNPTILLDAEKWYPVDIDSEVIVDDPFDGKWALDHDSRYDGKFPMRGEKLKSLPVYARFKIVPALPKVEVAKAATPPAAPAQPPAPARAYPMAVAGNVRDDKYYPTNSRLAQVFDDPFDDHRSCFQDPRYPGNKPIYGQTLNRRSGFYQQTHFRLVAPIALDAPANAPAAPIIYSNDVTPPAAAPAVPTCQMIYEPNDRFGSYVASVQEQLELDVDYWASMAHDGELPQLADPSPAQIEPAALAPAGKQSDVPKTVQDAAPATAQPAKRVEDGKFYVTDNKLGGKIFAQAYDTPEAARKHVADVFHQRVESGATINEEPRFDHWVIVATNGSGNGNGASKPGMSWADKSNSGEGKDSTRSAWEAQGVANAQAAQKRWLNALDFRILVETNLVEVNEEILQRSTKPLKALVIEALHLAAGEIDRAAFGIAVGTFVSSVAERPVKVAQ